MNKERTEIRTDQQEANLSLLKQQSQGKKEVPVSSTCCPPTEQVACCQPSEKETCCSPASSTGCGCK